MRQWQQLLEEVIRDRRPALVGYACLFAANRRDAEDLVQDALVRTFAKVRVIRDPYAVEGHLRQAIRTAFLDGVRKQRTWRAKAHLFAVDASAAGPEGAGNARVDVRAALNGLSPRERACTVLRFFDDLPLAQIASELGLSTGAVKRYLSDATAKLRLSLDVDPRWDEAPAREHATITALPERRTS